ncbi:ParB/RepB/Spo0J family partition protein [Dactylosporangium sp. NPDC051485]|uniref:ParB/RepB/Spo0J family partition protein n=1 Tax=Dactylosporangium sp. NPDC051485 TaxID=3154846 RepID=UPI00343E63F3
MRENETALDPFPVADAVDGIERLPVVDLDDGDSPRVNGIDERHAELLAASGAALPPIVVDRRTRRIVDGHHRLRAAVLRGQDHIDARLIDAPPDLLFMLAVRANITHGLPLSYADRRAAAVRIVRSHPHWSDRAIAQASGLSARTIATLRDPAQPRGQRIGLDGRRRDGDVAERRVRAAEALQVNPAATLHEVAATVGLSPATVHDVRRRLEQRIDVVPDGLRAAERPKPATPLREPADWASRRTVPATAGAERQALLDGLKRDPTLRYTESGRALLRLFIAATAAPARCGDFAAEFAAKLRDEAPVECREAVARLAWAQAHDWLMLAEHLERRAATSA